MLRKHIEAYILQLKSENRDRSIGLNDPQCSQYNHTVLTVKYNATIDNIERLEAILKATENETE